MKNFVLLLLGLWTTSAMANNNPENGKVAIDASKSVLVWNASKVSGSHEGLVNLTSGSLNFDQGSLSGGNFNIDMTSIKVTDLEGEWAGKLTGHLKSPDFFDVKNHPTANLKITDVKGKNGSYNITADLTIKEITHPVSFEATVKDGKAKAKVIVDRTKYDVRYGSGKFFEGLGDNLIYDEFNLVVTLVY